MGGKNMDESTVIKELRAAIDSLRTLALVALDMEESHPLALPEPPQAARVAAYEQHMTTISSQVAPSHQPLLARSLRDYRAGFPDRAATYLQELVGKFLQDPEYTTALTPGAQRQLQECLAALREL
jgi:hypothetical protein